MSPFLFKGKLSKAVYPIQEYLIKLRMNDATQNGNLYGALNQKLTLFDAGANSQQREYMKLIKFNNVLVFYSISSLIFFIRNLISIVT